MLRRLLSRPPERDLAAHLYGQAVAAARRPVFYAEIGVPDTVDGRYDMLVVHLHLLLRRLRDAGPPAPAVAQDLVDRFVTDMDANLREMGVGDLAVAKRVHHTLGGFYGRAKVYDAALDAGDPDALTAAVDRNVFGSVAADPAAAAAVADRVRVLVAALAAMPDAAILDRRFAYPEPASGPAA